MFQTEEQDKSSEMNLNEMEVIHLIVQHDGHEFLNKVRKATDDEVRASNRTKKNRKKKIQTNIEYK